jgi:DNA-binding NtrC family response regulator
MVLVYAGYAVDMAEDGAAAWETLQANRYELVITDNNIPKLTGIELLKKLRSARMRLPVIMATGKMPTQELSQNPEFEPVVMLSKPYATDQLLDAVKDALHTVSLGSNQPRVAPQQDGAGVFSVERNTAGRKLG